MLRLMMSINFDVIASNSLIDKGLLENVETIE